MIAASSCKLQACLAGFEGKPLAAAGNPLAAAGTATRTTAKLVVALMAALPGQAVGEDIASMVAVPQAAGVVTEVCTTMTSSYGIPMFEQGILIAWVISVLLAFTCGWCMGLSRQREVLGTRDVGVQSQCTYTWWTQTPRFKPLPDRAHGAEVD